MTSQPAPPSVSSLWDRLALPWHLVVSLLLAHFLWSQARDLRKLDACLQRLDRVLKEANRANLLHQHNSSLLAQVLPISKSETTTSIRP